uniref:Uncharacterized protein n=1 Tax=Mustela putorius furo TaxID=9669 RepID=M3XMB3_MUSPF
MAGTNEGHSNSATRRTKNFMGIVRSTPPCDGNVLGHQAGYLRAEKRGCLGRLSPTQGRGRPATVVPSAQAQRGVGGGERERPRPAPPGEARRRRGDSAQPRPGAPARSGFGNCPREQCTGNSPLETWTSFNGDCLRGFRITVKEDWSQFMDTCSVHSWDQGLSLLPDAQRW